MPRVELPMPQFGEAIGEGTVTRWLKEAGEQVESDEVVVEISTDKADVELTAPCSGTLAEIVVDAGVTVPVGAVLALIDASSPVGVQDEEVPAEETSAGHPASEAAHPPTPSGIPTDPDSATTFICYAREDGNFAGQLALSLVDQGVSVWLDEWSIPPGADWNRSIDHAIDSCGRMIVVLSPDSVESDQVQSEWMSALDAGKLVVPVLHRSCRVPRLLRLKQYVDFSRSSSTFEFSVSQVVGVLGESPTSS